MLPNKRIEKSNQHKQLDSKRISTDTSRKMEKNQTITGILRAYGEINNILGKGGFRHKNLTDLKNAYKAIKLKYNELFDNKDNKDNKDNLKKKDLLSVEITVLNNALDALQTFRDSLKSKEKPLNIAPLKDQNLIISSPEITQNNQLKTNSSNNSKVGKNPVKIDNTSTSSQTTQHDKNNLKPILQKRTVKDLESSNASKLKRDSNKQEHEIHQNDKVKATLNKNAIDIYDNRYQTINHIKYEIEQKNLQIEKLAEEMQIRLNEAQGEIDEKTIEVALLDERIKTLEKEIKNAEGKHDLTKEILRNANEMSTKQKNELQNKINLLENEIKEKQTKIENLVETNKNLQELIGKQQNIQDTINERDSDVKTSTAIIKAQEDQIKLLKTLGDNAQMFLKSLESSEKVNEETIELLKQQAESLRKSLHELQKRHMEGVDIVKANVNNLKEEEKENLESIISSLDNLNIMEKSTIDALEENDDLSNTKRKTKEINYNNLYVIIENLDREKEKLKTKNEEEHNKVINLTKEMNVLKKEIENITEEKSKLEISKSILEIVLDEAEDYEADKLMSMIEFNEKEKIFKTKELLFEEWLNGESDEKDAVEMKNLMVQILLNETKNDNTKLREVIMDLTANRNDNDGEITAITLHDMDTNITRLLGQILIRDAKIREGEGAIGRLIADYNNLANNANRQLYNLDQHIEHQGQTIEFLTNRRFLSVYEAEYNDTNEKIEILEKDVAHLKDAVTAKEEELSALAEKHQQSVQEMKTQHQNDINAKNTTIDSLKEDVAHLKDAVTAKEEELTALAEKHQQSIEGMEKQHKEEIAAKNTTIEFYKDKEKELREAAAIAKEEELTALAEKHQQSIEGMEKQHKEEIAAKNTTIDSLKEDVAHLKDAVTAKEEELTALAEKHQQSIEGMEKQHKEEIAAKNTTIEFYKDKEKELREAAAIAKKEELTALAEKHQQSTEQWKLNFEKERKLFQQARSKIHTLNLENKAKNEQNNALESELTQTKEELASSRKALNRENQLKTMIQRGKELNDQSEKLQADLAKQNTELKELDSKGATQDQVAALEKSKKDLEAKFLIYPKKEINKTEYEIKSQDRIDSLLKIKDKAKRVSKIKGSEQRSAQFESINRVLGKREGYRSRQRPEKRVY